MVSPSLMQATILSASPPRSQQHFWFGCLLGMDINSVIVQHLAGYYTWLEDVICFGGSQAVSGVDCVFKKKTPRWKDHRRELKKQLQYPTVAELLRRSYLLHGLNGPKPRWTTKKLVLNVYFSNNLAIYALTFSSGVVSNGMLALLEQVCCEPLFSYIQQSRPLLSCTAHIITRWGGCIGEPAFLSFFSPVGVTAGIWN